MTSYTSGAMRAAIAAHEYIREADLGTRGVRRDELAAIISKETGDAELLAALEDLMLVCGSTGDSFADFEEQAVAFQRETGKMRPGKDVPEAAADMGATREEYSAWVQGKLEQARAAIARARGEQP